MHIEHPQRTGIHTQAHPVLLRKAINEARGLGQLLTLVSMLSQETEALMNIRQLSDSDIHQIAVPLAKIRLLLTALAPLRCGREVNCREDALVRDLVDRFRDIEGRLKEMRNDLARSKKSLTP